MPPNPACRSLTRQDFRSVFQTALRSLSNRSKVVVGNYCISPITAEQYREKTRPLRPRRSCFAPAETRLWLEPALVEAPGTAPGSEWFIATVVYFHSRRAGTPNIGGILRKDSALSQGSVWGFSGMLPEFYQYRAKSGWFRLVSVSENRGRRSRLNRGGAGSGTRVPLCRFRTARRPFPGYNPRGDESLLLCVRLAH